MREHVLKNISCQPAPAAAPCQVTEIGLPFELERIVGTLSIKEHTSVFREPSIVVQFIRARSAPRHGLRGPRRTPIPLAIYNLLITHSVMNRNAETVGDQTGIVTLFIRNQMIE